MKNIQLSLLLVLMSLMNGISQETPLLEAIADENLVEAKNLIERYQNISGGNGSSECPLSRIIEKAAATQKAEINKTKSKHSHKEWVELAKLIIDKGVDVNYKLSRKVSLIEFAIQNRQKEITNYFLDKNAVIPDKPILFLFAIEDGLDTFVSRYLEKGYAIAGENEMGLSALHLAVQMGNISLCSILLDKGAEVEAKVKGKRYNYLFDMTPLHIAAANGQSEIVKILLERGAQVNALVKDKKTALHLAVCAARIENNYAKSEMKGSMIKIAAQMEVIEVFIAGGNLETVKVLLAKNADIHAQDALKLTPFHWAIYYRQFDIADALIDLGSTPLYSKKSADHLFASALSELWYQVKKKNKTTCNLTQAKIYFENAAKDYQSSLNKKVAWEVTKFVLTAAANVGSAYYARLEAQKKGYAFYDQYSYSIPNDEKEKKKYYKAQKIISEQLAKWCDSAPTALPYSEPTLLSVLTLLNVKKLMSADKE